MRSKDENGGGEACAKLCVPLPGSLDVQTAAGSSKKATRRARVNGCEQSRLEALLDVDGSDGSSRSLFRSFSTTVYDKRKESSDTGT